MPALSGKTAIVTGGGSGIGEGIALAGLGVNVVVGGRRREPLTKVVAAIEREGGQATAVQADVSSEAEVARAVLPIMRRQREGHIIWLLTRRANVKIGRPILIQTMENPWQ